MIRDGVIIYDARTVNFWSWHLNSEKLNAAAVGLLATILAYQLTAAFYNVRFGSKHVGVTSASEIQSFLLTECSSPLMISAALVRHDILDIARFRDDLPLNVKIARRNTKVNKRTAFSLIALLFVAPLFNIFSIFIALQRDKTVTVNQARGCRFALGVNSQIPDIELLRSKFWDIRTICDRIPSYVIGPATSLLRFSRCFSLSIPVRAEISGDLIRITAETTHLGQIKVSVISLLSNISVSAAIHVDVSSQGQLFRIQPLFPLKDAAKLVHTGQEKLSDFCDLAKVQYSPHDEDKLKVEFSNGLFGVSKDFSCNLTNLNAFGDIVFSMTRINIIEHEADFHLLNVESIRSETTSAPEYFNAGHIPILIRRDRIVNLLPLFLITSFSVILRIVTECVFNNDIREAVEAIMRCRLDDLLEQSLMTSSRIITYGSKCQDGDVGHYGLPRTQLNEVKEFGKGVEIGLTNVSLTTSSEED